MADLAREVCPRKFWSYTVRPLTDIADILVNHRIVASTFNDCENVYEWLECELEGSSIELNISRKHNDGNADKAEPLVFFFVGKDLSAMTSIVDELAHCIESALQESVTLGTIDYLGGDEFRYIPDGVS